MDGEWTAARPLRSHGRRVNLAFLIGHFPPGAFGGAELQAEAWASRLAARHRVTVITRRDPAGQPERERRDGFDVVRLPVSRVPLARTALDLGGIARALDALAPKPDLVLAFQTFISGLAGVRAQDRLGVPAVVWVRGESEYRLERSWTMRRIAPGVWSRARGVLVQSEANRALVMKALESLAPARAARVAEKIAVVPNGLDLPRPPFGSGGRVLIVGRLIRDKGVDVALDAAAGLQALVTVAGDGPERTRLAAQARRLDLDVRFEGNVGRDRLDQLYRGASAVVLASRRGEGLPNVLLEALAYGRAVVATPVSGVCDLVRDGVNGLLVPPGDEGALRTALARLAHERGLAERLGAAARETAERFAWERVRPALEEALERWRRR
jgi:glycosyltransferase involved in cell wall biosynthesis